MKHKFDVLFRTLAAMIGGYLVSVAFSLAAVPLLVWTGASGPNEAVMVATMFSYLIYFCVIIISFCRRNSLLLWRDIVLAISLCAAIFYILGER